ncbi:MAG: TonB-dependent receptor plug domain-containing protein, partial [Bacteroidales bacterium]|nr:TonB-dependent receptor plug domain-containing protein [Bacteroidales bacterium]
PQEETTTGKIIQENDESLQDETTPNKNSQNESGSESNDNDKIKPGNENEALISPKKEYFTQVTDTGHSEKLGSKFNPYNPYDKLYIVDGIEYKGDINDLDTNDIETIDVLKEASATVFYGERGKNGVVLINTKSGNRSGLSQNNGHFEITGKVVSWHDRQPIPGATIFFTANDNKSGTISNNSGEFSIRTNNSKVFLEFLSEGYRKNEFVWDGNKELLVEMESDNTSIIPDKTAEKTKWGKMLEKAGIGRYPEGMEPVVIQDGYETLHNANDIAGLYNPEIIRSIRYTKNTNIDIKRKELAKNGFIEIKTTLPKQDKKLCIIDGEEVLLKNQKPSVYIYPKQLQTMKEISKDEAVKKYGSKAKHGAVEITTKSNSLTNETGVSRANNPLIVVDGIVTGFKSVDHINPADIQSVTILKDAKAAERYGEKGRDGVIEITLKPVRIYTELQLRKFIASEIKYPLLAQKSNIEKTVNLSVKIDNEGIIDIISEESSATDFNLDEVVVVGYGPQDSVVTGYPSKDAAVEARKVKEQLLVDEAKRVINKISKLDIEKFKGKTVGVKMKFMLQ